MNEGFCESFILGCCPLLMVVLFLGSGAARSGYRIWAQSPGRVTDPAGAVTSQCAIEIQNVNTGGVRTTVVNK